MVTISERLKEAMDKFNISQAEIVRRTGINKGSLSCYINGKYEPKQQGIYKLAEALNVDEGWLMGHDVPMERRIVNKSDTLKEVSIIFNDYFPLKYRTNLSAGSFDEIMDSEPDAVVYVPIKFQTKKDKLKAFKVNGTSMNNIIPDESIVVIEPVTNSSELKDGTIVAAWHDGTATVKRIYTNGNTVTLMPDSKDKSHQPIMINTEITPVQIIGKVIWHMNPDNINKDY